MKFFFGKWFTVFLLLFCVLSGCKNNDDQDPFEMLTRNSWRPSMIDFDPASSPEGNVEFYPWSDCQLQFQMGFERDTLVIRQSDSSCQESSATLFKPGKYAFSFLPDEGILRFNGAELKVIDLSSRQLKISAVLPSAAGFMQMIFLFNRQ